LGLVEDANAMRVPREPRYGHPPEWAEIDDPSAILLKGTRVWVKDTQGGAWKGTYLVAEDTCVTRRVDSGYGSHFVVNRVLVYREGRSPRSRWAPDADRLSLVPVSPRVKEKPTRKPLSPAKVAEGIGSLMLGTAVLFGLLVYFLVQGDEPFAGMGDFILLLFGLPIGGGGVLYGIDCLRGRS
jgi:hypothetical protein